MAPKKKEADPVIDTPLEPVMVADVGAALYRDKAGSPRTKQMTEGQANFASVKGLAEEAVASAKAPPKPDKEDA